VVGEADAAIQEGLNGDFVGGIAKMHRRLAFGSLGRQAAMIDALFVPVPLEVAVGKMRPLLPPLAELVLVELPVLRRRETLPPQCAPRHHQVRVMVPLVAFLVRRVNGDVDGVALPHKGLAGEVLHQPLALLVRQLVRQ